MPQNFRRTQFLRTTGDELSSAGAREIAARTEFLRIAVAKRAALTSGIPATVYRKALAIDESRVRIREEGHRGSNFFRAPEAANAHELLHRLCGGTVIIGAEFRINRAGCTLLTVTPVGPSSRDNARVKPRTANSVAT